jgi:hypothetical protein
VELTGGGARLLVVDGEDPDNALPDTGDLGELAGGTADDLGDAELGHLGLLLGQLLEELGLGGAEEGVGFDYHF